MSADGMGKWVFLLLLGVAIVAAVRVGIRVPPADPMDSGPAIAVVSDSDARTDSLERVTQQEPETSVVQMPASFSLFGHPGKAVERDRCSEDARNEMAGFARKAEAGPDAEEGGVLVGESWWGTLSTTSRIGIASWLSHCNHEGRSVRIRGAESGAVLATYDSSKGYRPNPGRR